MNENRSSLFELVLAGFGFAAGAALFGWLASLWREPDVLVLEESEDEP